ncbi:hypothetical protein ACJX0J_040435, partial [Zea mays]
IDIRTYSILYNIGVPEEILSKFGTWLAKKKINEALSFLNLSETRYNRGKMKKCCNAREREIMNGVVLLVGKAYYILLILGLYGLYVDVLKFFIEERKSG